jgi:hypothetical protein
MTVRAALHRLIDEVVGEPETALRRLELHELVDEDEDGKHVEEKAPTDDPKKED